MQLTHKLALGVMVAALSLTSCAKRGSNTEVEPQPIADQLPDPVELDLDEIIERGTLRALVNNSSTSYYLYRGRPMGFEYELLQLLADDLGVELELHVVSDLDEAFRQLNLGKGDILAYNLTVTKERQKFIDFSIPLLVEPQVLVQRKPENWRAMTLDNIDRSLVRQPFELIGEEINVRKGASYVQRLNHLAEEVGGDIVIVEEDGEVETEMLIRQVAKGEIDFTVADRNIAKLISTYYPNLDYQTPISLNQRMAWGVRTTSTNLKKELDDWLRSMKRRPTFNVLYQKYYESPKSTAVRLESPFSSSGGGSLSPYDSLIKQEAERIGWDWLLVASAVYQESQFDPKATSWAGAEGLFQLMPATAEQFGLPAGKRHLPAASLKAGASYLAYLDELWEVSVPDSAERQKFVLASYNAGPGHVSDAVRLAEKYGAEPRVWYDNVEVYLRRKSQPKYYEDALSRHGYCRGSEPTNYVRDILERYEVYHQFMREEVPIDSLQVAVR